MDSGLLSLGRGAKEHLLISRRKHIKSCPVTTLYLGLEWTDESGKRGEGALVDKSQKA